MESMVYPSTCYNEYNVGKSLDLETIWIILVSKMGTMRGVLIRSYRSVSLMVV